MQQSMSSLDRSETIRRAGARLPAVEGVVAVEPLFTRARCRLQRCYWPRAVVVVVTTVNRAHRTALIRGLHNRVALEECTTDATVVDMAVVEDLAAEHGHRVAEMVVLGPDGIRTGKTATVAEGVLRAVAGRSTCVIIEDGLTRRLVLLSNHVRVFPAILVHQDFSVEATADVRTKMGDLAAAVPRSIPVAEAAATVVAVVACTRMAVGVGVVVSGAVPRSGRPGRREATPTVPMDTSRLSFSRDRVSERHCFPRVVPRDESVLRCRHVKRTTPRAIRIRWASSPPCLQASRSFESTKQGTTVSMPREVRVRMHDALLPTAAVAAHTYGGRST
eukprot:m.997060 g.997060  ORF g.997060 m.997060 type:complete len:333 (+) comp24021_c0_seq18:414-1412(+)